MSKRVVSLLLTLLLALSVCVPAFATAVKPADRPDVSESAETEETAPAEEEEPSEEDQAEEAPTEEAPAEEATEPEEEPEATSEEVDEISQDDIAPISTGSDYYVVWDEETQTLTFQNSPPEGGDNNVDYWGQNADDGFLEEPLSKEDWHTSDMKSKVKNVVFEDPVTVNGLFMFADFTSLNSVTIKEKVTVNLSARAMFYNCSELSEINGIKNLDTSGVTVMWSMFKNCSSLRSLDLSSFDTSEVTTMLGMFDGCSRLETLEGLKYWDTSNVNAMENIFENCSLLTELFLDNWDIQGVRDERGMFRGCTSLRTLSVGSNFHMDDSHDDGANQIHASDDVGVWTKDGNNQWTDQEFIKLFERGNAAGTYYWAHKLTYDPNGHSGEDVPTDEKAYKFGDQATLAGQGGIQPNGKEVFIGWSTEPKGTVTSKAGESDVVKEGGTVTFADKGITVYAVFAVDVNNNGTPDYDEYVTVTFDINGGDGSKESETEHQTTYTVKDLLPGSPLAMRIYYTLKWTKEWDKDGAPATHPAILAGWTKDKRVAEDIILENDLDPGGALHSRLLINRDEEKVPETDTTYYAVYAEDENGDQTMDYLENSLHVEYYANGGKRTDGKWVDEEEGIFYRCNHHHVPFEDGVVLLTVEQGKAYVERDGATLIGWSETVVKNLVADEDAEKAAKIVTGITMPPAGNKQVYAVWAVDVNNNDIPDYKEEKVTVTFNIGGGHGTGTDPEHSKTFTVKVLPGTEFNLPEYAELHWSEAWEKDGAAADFEAILAGWADHPINDVILEDDVNYQAAEHAELSLEMIREPHVTITKDITFYAVYAADENGDDEPDYMEFANQVEYYANGGKMVGGGSWVDGKNELFYRCGHHHVVGEEVTLLLVDRGKELVKRDGAVLIGWSEDHVVLVTSAAAEEDTGIISTYIMPSRNGRVYAVWAIDENGNGTPDYEETATPEEPTPEPTPEATPSTKPTPTPTPKPDYGIIPDVPWYQYQPEDEGEYVPGPDEVTYSGFPDVDPSAWYAGPVGWAAQSGVTAGYPDGNFHPDDTCTRAQIVTFLWKAAGTPMSVGTTSFGDVEQGSFYYDAAVWAANSGIIAGYPDGNFHPDDPCTRAQIVAMLYRYANSPAVSGESKFFDVDASAYYYNAAIWAEQNGIVAGYPDGGFHPDDACTRAQIVTMLYNYIKG